MISTVTERKQETIRIIEDAKDSLGRGLTTLKKGRYDLDTFGLTFAESDEMESAIRFVLLKLCKKALDLEINI